MKPLNNNTGRAMTLALMLTAGLLLSACSEQSPDDDPVALAKRAIDQAQTHYQASADAAYAWVPAKTALALATEAFEAGDMETALLQAERATMLAEASLVQAKIEQNSWLKRFPKPPAGATSTRDKP